MKYRAVRNVYARSRTYVLTENGSMNSFGNELVLKKNKKIKKQSAFIRHARGIKSLLSENKLERTRRAASFSNYCRRHVRRTAVGNRRPRHARAASRIRRAAVRAGGTIVERRAEGILFWCPGLGNPIEIESFYGEPRWGICFSLRHSRSPVVSRDRQNRFRADRCRPNRHARKSVSDAIVSRGRRGEQAPR